MFSKLAWIEEASLRAHCTQLLEQALSSCANTEASATAIVANASTSVEDDSDFFNFMIIKSSPTPPSQAHLEFLNENRTELSNVVIKQFLSDTILVYHPVLLTIRYSFFGTQKTSQ